MDCYELFNCCSCGYDGDDGEGCGCGYCFDCNACQSCVNYDGDDKNPDCENIPDYTMFSDIKLN